MISQVSSAEVLLDYGTYKYFENDNLKNIEELWTQHKLDDTIITRVKRLAPDFDQYFDVQTWARAGQFQRAFLGWRSSSQSATAEYRFKESRWILERTVNGLISTDEVTAEVVFSPLMRVFTGESIQKIIGRGGAADVLVPWIKDPSTPEKMFSINISNRRANCLDAVAKLYSYQGEQYDENARFCLDENDLLLRYEWRMNASSKWRVELARPALSQLNADWL